MKCGIEDKSGGIDKVFGYVLSDPFANVEGVKMNHQNQSSITKTHISEDSFRLFDDVMKKGCHFVRLSSCHPEGCIMTVAMKLAIITVNLRGII